jgi:predicted RNA methylase
VDCTVGLGGHTRALLDAGATRVLGFDRDPEALAVARTTLAPWVESNGTVTSPLVTAVGDRMTTLPPPPPFCGTPTPGANGSFGIAEQIRTMLSSVVSSPLS